MTVYETAIVFWGSVLGLGVSLAIAGGTADRLIREARGLTQQIRAAAPRVSLVGAQRISRLPV
jgi:hypothetical protein